MNKYKVGDEVTIVDDAVLPHKIGDIGTVVRVDTLDEDVPYLVAVNEEEWWYRECCLSESETSTQNLQDALAYCTRSNTDPLKVVKTVHKWFHENYEWKRLETGDALPEVGSKVRAEVQFGNIKPGNILSVSFHSTASDKDYGRVVFTKPNGAFFANEISVLVKKQPKSTVKYIRLNKNSERPAIGSKVRIEDNFVATSGSAIIGKVYEVVKHSCFDTDFSVICENGELTYVENYEVSLVVEE